MFNSLLSAPNVWCTHSCLVNRQSNKTSWLSVARPANRQSTKKHSTYQLLYIYSIPPDDGLQICPNHEEIEWRNKLTINGASSWI